MSQNCNSAKSLTPSLPAGSFNEIESLFAVLSGIANEIQIDLVDGKFAPFTSWPFTEADSMKELLKLAKYTDTFSIEMDCMVLEPEQYLDIFVEIGVKRVIVHLRSTERYEEIIKHARTHGYRIGFALVNDVPLSELELYIDRIDFVQLMGIKEIGQQGQPFDERVLERARELREKYPLLEISIDGSVNKETIPALLEAGVNRFAPGSAIAKQPDPKVAFLELQKLII